MSELRALIFDVDGTLADTERDGHRVAFNRAFRDAGLDWDWTVELYGALLTVTGGKERIRHYIERDRPDFKTPADLSGFIADLHKAKTRYYVEMLAAGGIPLRTGVKRLLTEATQAGLRLAIATTTTPENVTALLGKAELGLFEFIGAGDVVPAKKPAPDIYLYVLAKLQLPADACIAFEDSAQGLKSSLGAGLLTIVTVNDYTRRQNFSGAALVVDSLGDLGMPFDVLDGDPAGQEYVDMALVRRLERSRPG